MALALGRWLPGAFNVQVPRLPFQAGPARKGSLSPGDASPQPQDIPLQDFYEGSFPARTPLTRRITGPHNEDLTARFTALANAPMSDTLRAQLRGRTVVFVRGYLARLYVACGGTYLDKHAEYCRSLGMRVIMGDVHGGANAAHNSATLFRQIATETTADDSVFIFAHSYGALAALELLTSPVYSSIHDRIDAFIPINGVFQGTPIAEVDGVPLVGGVLGRTWGKTLALFGGDSDTLVDMKPSSRKAYFEANETNILNMLQRATVVSLATTYNSPAGPWDVWGFGMLLAHLYMRYLGLANDGAVPQQSQILPGSKAVILGGMHHAAAIDDLGRCDLHKIMQGLLGLTLESMPPERRERRKTYITCEAGPTATVGGGAGTM